MRIHTVSCQRISSGLVLGSIKVLLHEENFLTFQKAQLTMKQNNCHKTQ